jgi:hypothetical protein
LLSADWLIKRKSGPRPLVHFLYSESRIATREG